MLVLAAIAVGGRDVDLQLRLERERVFLLLEGSQLCELELVAEGRRRSMGPRMRTFLRLFRRGARWYWQRRRLRRRTGAIK